MMTESNAYSAVQPNHPIFRIASGATDYLRYRSSYPMEYL